MNDVLFAIWFLLPAALSNAAPIFSAKIPALKRYDTPMDFGKEWHGHRIFGAHKTWRGLISGIIVSTVVLYVQQVLFVHTDWAKALSGPVDYAALPVLLLGPAFAIGALGGDAIESFFKRALRIKPGGSLIPFDQLDYIIGSVLVSLFFVILSPVHYVWIFIIWFVMHVVASYVGYLLKFKDDPI
jgi:CDP-2,3-bis-(O-geranylgeranyl)-sn-glycerol synthase